LATLTREQIAFIKKIGLAVGDAFDASGMQAKEWKLQMRDVGKVIAFGVTPCGNFGHSLRTRAGHCVQCNTANLGYLLRFSKRADVYVAWSSAGKLAKIGYSLDANSRSRTLNEWKYGGQDDWEIKLIYECDDAGRVEKIAQAKLARYRKQGITYMNGLVRRSCTELFKCKLVEAVKALESSVDCIGDA
jgi:hypothetical protein